MIDSPSTNGQVPGDSAFGRLLEHIEEFSSSAAGDHLLRRLARQMAAASGARWSLVSEGHNGRLKSVAFWSGEDYGEPVEFAVAGTPFEHIFSGGPAFHSSGVQQAFPLDGWLASLGAEGFAALPLFGSDGTPLGHLSVISDQALYDESLLPTLRLFGLRAAAELERWSVERKLRASEERYRRLVESSPDIIYRYSYRDHRMEYVNGAMERAFGYSASEFYQDRDLLMKMVAEPLGDEEAILDGRIFHSTNVRHWKRRDGTEIWTEQHNVPIYDESGALVAQEGVARDVTDRVLAERALAAQLEVMSALVQAIPDRLFRVNVEGELTPIVDDGGTGTSLEELIPRNALAEAHGIVAAAIEDGTVQSMQYRVGTQDVESVFELRVAPARDGGAIAIVRDITAATLLMDEAEHRALREELEEKIEVEVTARNPYALSFRELTVLHLLAGGKADKEIARQLGISPYTVNRHVSNILGKMGASSRTEAGVRAVRENLLA
jgi:PAS domain S-box-containing protein